MVYESRVGYTSCWHLVRRVRHHASTGARTPSPGQPPRCVLEGRAIAVRWRLGRAVALSSGDGRRWHEGGTGRPPRPSWASGHRQPGRYQPGHSASHPALAHQRPWTVRVERFRERSGHCGVWSVHFPLRRQFNWPWALATRPAAGARGVEGSADQSRTTAIVLRLPTRSTDSGAEVLPRPTKWRSARRGGADRGRERRSPVRGPVPGLPAAHTWLCAPGGDPRLVANSALAAASSARRSC